MSTAIRAGRGGSEAGQEWVESEEDTSGVDDGGRGDPEVLLHDADVTDRSCEGGGSRGGSHPEVGGDAVDSLDGVSTTCRTGQADAGRAGMR